MHLCFGYAAIIHDRPYRKTIIPGVLNLGDPAVETSGEIVRPVERALPYGPAGRLVLAPDCR